jgi:hypothetical protein
MVGFYHYEEGDAKDMLTTSTGTLYNQATVADGKVTFDGAAPYDYVSYTTAAEHRATGNEYTLFVRSKKNVTTHNFFMMRWYKAGSSNRYLWNHSSGYYLAYLYAFGVDYTPVQSGEMDENTFATTHSEYDDNQYCYLNGVWVNTLFTGSGTIRYHVDELQIQGMYTPTQYTVDGYVSEVRIYGRALSSAELTRLTQEGDHR